MQTVLSLGTPSRKLGKNMNDIDNSVLNDEFSYYYLPFSCHLQGNLMPIVPAATLFSSLMGEQSISFDTAYHWFSYT